MVTKTYEFLRNFRGSIPEKFSGISEGKKFRRNPQEFLEAYYLT